MSRQLLPPNCTALESALADALAVDLDVSPLRGLADSARCPAALLPWLAWAMSVDSWDAALTERQQRALIRESIPIHKRKGTAGAVRRAMAALGIAIEYLEWRDLPGAAPYTFQLTAWANDNHDPAGPVLSEDIYHRLRRVVDEAKNERSHYTFRVGAQFGQPQRLASVARICTVQRDAAQCLPPPAPVIHQPVQIASASAWRGVMRFSLEG
ncbi:phage tail protein I [Chromobacterium haemolyticum]|uniref:phage tail protein I n=1 Tax=Chromobacterium haemolyticum TaxID=394935 RepID=UPI000DF01804|nr:phage tail protein I [Chromobacterium haemolyticum]